MTRHRNLTEQAAEAAVDSSCRVLRLHAVRAQFNDMAEAATKEQMTYRGYLAECDERNRRRSERRIRSAAFPRQKYLREFDFTANPNIDPATIHALAANEWVRKGEPLCLIGHSGTGKSHLLIALGTEAAMAGYSVRYVLASKLANELVEAAYEKVLTKTIARYGRVDLLCIDELGYMQLDKHGAESLFQILTDCEEKKAIAIASNESFRWLVKDLHRPAAVRRDRRPAHLRRGDHRDWHRLLPPRRHPGQTRQILAARTRPANRPGSPAPRHCPSPSARSPHDAAPPGSANTRPHRSRRAAPGRPGSWRPERIRGPRTAGRG
jgi:DNA replication protein DnaC